MINFLLLIISAPISIAIYVLLCIAIEWLLGWAYKIIYSFYRIITLGRYDSELDIDHKIDDFKFFIFTTCLSTLISSGIAGYIGGLICPKKHGVTMACLFTLFILPILILSSVTFWDTERWFYSSVWILDMIISGVIFVGSAYVANKNV